MIDLHPEAFRFLCLIADGSDPTLAALLRQCEMVQVSASYVKIPDHLGQSCLDLIEWFLTQPLSGDWDGNDHSFLAAVASSLRWMLGISTVHDAKVPSAPASVS